MQRLRPVMPAGQGKSDLEIFTALAVLMGKADMSYAGPEQVMAEISELVDVYRGISYDRLAQGGIPWPCVDGEDPGKATLYEGGFPHGKARFAVALPLTAPPDETLPFWLIPRVLKFHSGSFSQWSSSLMEVSPAPIAEMDYSDLRALGIKDGEEIAIVSSQGDTIKLPVKCSERARSGIILVPQHFSSIRLNTLTRWDYPGVPVRVEKA